MWTTAGKLYLSSFGSRELRTDTKQYIETPVRKFFKGTVFVHESVLRLWTLLDYNELKQFSLHSSLQKKSHMCISNIWTFMNDFVVYLVVFGVFDQVRLKPVCAATETSYGLETSAIASSGIILSRQRTTKALIRLRGCAGWTAPLLFAYGINRFSRDVAESYLAPSDLILVHVFIYIFPCNGFFALPRLFFHLMELGIMLIKSCLYNSIRWQCVINYN